MAQAKTFKTEELEQVLDYVKLTKHAQRNRAILLLTHWAGLRVGEVAALRMCDVLDANMSIKSEIRLSPEQTKGGHARTVFLNEKLRSELQTYADTLKTRDPQWAFFPTQKFPRRGFTANTLTQHMNTI